MNTVIIVILVALVVAVIVIALAAVNDTDREPGADFLADMRDGWMRLWGRGSDEGDVSPHIQDYTIDDLFNVGDTQAPAYLDTTDIEEYVVERAEKVRNRH